MKKLFCISVLLFVAVASVGYFGFQTADGADFAATAFNDIDVKEAPYIQSTYDCEQEVVETRLFGIFDIGEKEARPVVEHSVLLGGTPLGIDLKVDGLMVTAKSGVITNDGTASPMDNVDVTFGDILYSVNGKKVDSAEAIAEILEGSDGAADLVFYRGALKKAYSVQAVRDMLSGKYKLGLMLQDSVAGIGTLTFIDPETGRFGCLGHAISGPDGTPVRSVYGTVYPAYITGAVKGKIGKAGELEGSFSTKDKPIGVLDKNSIYGNFGYYTGDMSDMQEIKVAPKEAITPGKAQIFSTVIGNEPELYDIEIIKVNEQDSPSDKSMVIRITDKELIEKTGGIVQGMSGSPIIRDGKLVGAVTHVFTSDPTKGFGIFVDWMLMQ